MDKSKKPVVVSNATKQEFTGEGFDESTYIAPVYDSSVRDFGIEFLLILILPLVVVIIIAIILAIIMFCFREGRWVQVPLFYISVYIHVHLERERFYRQ